MKYIPLTQNKFAIVDDDKFDWLNQWKWCVHKGVSTWYAERASNGKTIRMHAIRMHRVIMNTPRSMDTDHKNGNGLDNRVENLRICSRSNHHYNRKAKAGKYKGVNKSGRAGKWQARITVNRIRKSLGYYKTPIEAAKAYNAAAKQHCGQYARLNDV